MNSDPRKGARIGVLVPFTNTNLEPDMMLMCATDMTLHFQRMGGYDVCEIPGSDQMAGMGASDITYDLRMISGARPDVVLYGCTSATLTHGSDFDADLARKIKAGSDAICFTAAGSLVAGIKSLDVKSIGLSSPYLGKINLQAVDFLASNGIQTVKRVDIGRELSNYGQGELTPDEVYDLAVRADHPEAEAIVLSCTDMRSVEEIERIEATLDKPVVTSNQALFLCLMGALKPPRPDDVPGRLFHRLEEI